MSVIAKFLLRGPSLSGARQKPLTNVAISPSEPDSALPSEGRGQRFESSWVRQSLQRLRVAFGGAKTPRVIGNVRATMRCSGSVLLLKSAPLPPKEQV